MQAVRRSPTELIIVWWATVGWTSTGNLCYYGPHPLDPGVDARDLVQFIPRAIVFITVFIVYTGLFRFLRRPDTIQLSSQFEGERKRSIPRQGRVNAEAPWEQMEFATAGPLEYEMSPAESTVRFAQETTIGMPYTPHALDTPDSSAPFALEGEGETMKDFFKHSQVQNDVSQQVSASAYFNRQASLLMLYFPLAVGFACRAS
jgi:hypothetical protein